MKKIVSLLMAAVLVMSLATVAFAANNTSWNAPESVEELPGTVTLEAGEAIFYLLSNDYEGWKLSVSGGEFVINKSNPMYGGFGDVYSVGGTAEAELAQNSMAGITVGITNQSTEEQTYTLVVTPPPVGSQGNPAELKLDENNTCFTFEQGYMGYMYFFEYAATEGGFLTVDLVSSAASQYSFDLSNDIYDTAWSSESPNNDTATIGVRAGGTVLVGISASIVDGSNVESAAAVSISASFEAAEEGTKYNPIMIEDVAKEYSFEVPVNNADFTWISLSDVTGAILTIEDADAVIGTMMWDMQMADVDTGILSVAVYEDNYITGVKTLGDDTKYTVTVSEPEGFDENPEILDDISSVDGYIPGYGVDEYYYQWTAAQAGTLTLNAVATWDESEIDYVPVDDNGDPIAVPFTLTAGVVGTEGISDAKVVVLDVKAGDVVFIKLANAALEYDYAARTANVALTGTFDVLGSETNPVVVNMASALTGIDVAANGKTYIAINGSLNGMILNIQGDDKTSVNVNGKKIEAVAGVFSVELTGTPVNKVIVSNADTKAASYVASIEYAPGTENNPIVVESEKAFTSAAVAAGSEAYYAVSSKLNGYMLTVKGDAVVTVNGKEIKAENGAASVILEGTPVNKVIIANKGTADANYEVSLIAPADIPNTGDMGVVMSVAALAISAIGGVAMVAKKKEF